MLTWCRPARCSWCRPRAPVSAVRWRANRGNRPRGVRSNPHYPDDSRHTLYSPDSTKPPPTASERETEDERLLWCSEEWNSLNTIKERRERERERRAESRQTVPPRADYWCVRYQGLYRRILPQACCSLSIRDAWDGTVCVRESTSSSSVGATWKVGEMWAMFARAKQAATMIVLVAIFPYFHTSEIFWCLDTSGSLTREAFEHQHKPKEPNKMLRRLLCSC